MAVKKKSSAKKKASKRKVASGVMRDQPPMKGKRRAKKSTA